MPRLLNFQITSRLSSEVNIEVSATDAAPFSLYIYLNRSRPITTSLEFRTTYVYNIPVHVRYHDPKSGGGFREFKKQPAVLFARCPDGTTLTSSAVVKFPCKPNSADLCDWNSLPFTQVSNLLFSHSA